MRTLAKLVAVIIAAGAVLAGTVAALGVPTGVARHAGSGTPSTFNLAGLASRSYVYAADGSVLATLHDEVNRQPIPLREVPQHVIDAVIAVEDAGFWIHDGVDARGMLRAFAVNVEEGGISQGGSTITQQLVKLSLIDPATGVAKQTLDRKVTEIVQAQRLEKQFTKREILQRYLNSVYFGNHSYGIQAAAETYFGVAPKDLDVGQAAMLAGIIRNPNIYNPLRNPELVTNRREHALRRMVQTGKLTAAEATLYHATPLPTKVHQVLPTPDDYFVEAVKQQLLDDERLGETAEERYATVFGGGLKIHTTFDPRAQQLAIQARDSQLPLTEGLFFVGTEVNPETGKVENRYGSAGIVSVDPRTGAVRVMVGGPGFKKWKYNVVTQGRRQVGSAMKTFVLATLMEQGRSPGDQVSGSGPCRFANRYEEGGVYEVENFNASRGGDGTILSQTLRSSNCAFVRLGLIAGPENVIYVARQLGVRSPLQPVQSLPLGTMELTPLEMASAYAAFANEGVYNPPYLIERVDNRAGKVIFEHKPSPVRAVSAATARLVASVLQQNVRAGTGTAAQIYSGQPAAGKTGTTQDATDGWFVGFTPHLATAVWVGALQGKLPIHINGGPGITGGSYPARIWGELMRPYHASLPIVGFPPAPPRPGGQRLEVPGDVDLTPKPDPPPPPRPPSPGPPSRPPPGPPVPPPSPGGD